METTVVHLVPEMEQGGVESVVCALNRAAVQAGLRSVVVSRGGRLLRRIAEDGGEHAEMDIKSKNPLTVPWRVRRLRRLLAGIASRPDAGKIVVCTHSRVPAWLFRFANATLRLPWISYAHGANTVSRYSAVMAKGDAVVVPSDFLAGFLKSSYPDPTLPERVATIHPCVDLDRFDPARIDAEFVAAKRREWGIVADGFTTMAVGRITPVKGFANVIRDFASRHAGDSARLVIVGGADGRREAHLEELKTLAARLGAGDRTIFAGSQEKIPECLSIADEVVSGNVAKPESFGLSVAEAFAMEKPVRLLRHFGGAAEIVDAVAAERAATGCTAREAVRTLYGPERFARETVVLYRRLAATWRGRGVPASAG